MATLNIGGRRVTVDDNFFTLPPDQQNATVEEIASSFGAKPELSAGETAVDVVKSAAIGIPQGTIGAAGMAGDLQQAGKPMGEWLQSKLPEVPQGLKDLWQRGAVPEHRKERYMPTMPTSAEIQGDVEGVTGKFYEPKTTLGKYSNAGGQALGNPISYIGPGGLALKTGTAVLSGIGAEAGKQAAEGTGYEVPAQLAGALVGGGVAVKTLGPKASKAAIPTYEELKGAAKADYNLARASGLELNPKGVGRFAATVEQELTGPARGFTGGAMGDAPRTFAIIDSLQNGPQGATVTASNLDALRKNVGRLARETKDGKPTADAAAASVLLGRLNGYLENVPQNHIMAGDAAQYVRATKQGNANYAAAQRVRTVDLKRARAEENTAGGIATRLDNQLKSQVRTILNNPSKQVGFSPDELAAIKKVNRGTFTSNVASQFGRLGAGAGALLLHGGIAGGSGGSMLIPQAIAAAGLYGSRKLGEVLTKKHINQLSEMLAKRSPEYQRRVTNLPPPDRSTNTAALIRALLAQ